MERHPNKHLLPFLVLCCLLFLLPFASASAVPMPRSLRLRNQQHPPSLKHTPQDMMLVAAAARDLGGRAAAAARMAVEVDDYPGSGANHRHDPPQGPGRA